MSDRRRFLQRSASLVAGGFVSRFLNAATPSRKQRIRVGAQTSTFGVPITPFSRLLNVVSALGTLGYEGFETNWQALEPGANQPSEWRREFEARHVRLISAHCGATLYDKETTDHTMEQLRRIAGYTAAMGASHLIVSGPRLPHVGGKLDPTAVHNTTDGLNRLARVVHEEGMKFCYHNHSQEFEDDPSEMSFLLQETDPKLVWLNYDVASAYGVGPDPQVFSEAHFRRIAIYHIKDAKRDASGKVVPTDLGSGTVPLRGVVAPLLNSDWEGWLNVEREGDWPRPAPHPVEALRQCREYVKKITDV